MQILRYAAFTTVPEGGNPAGVVLDAAGVERPTTCSPPPPRSGYSETAFLLPTRSPVRPRRALLQPAGGGPFCGHATIAAAVAYADRHGAGQLDLRTRSGPVTVVTSVGGDGRTTATLTSVPPTTATIEPRDVDRPAHRPAVVTGRPRPGAARCAPPSPVPGTRWWPPRRASGWPTWPTTSRRSAGSWRARDWTTVQLVWRESAAVFHARDPFPPGGVVEDPATGAAAAALGGYLRELDLVAACRPTVTIHQGDDLGRPVAAHRRASPPAPGTGIDVTGTAVRHPVADLRLDPVGLSATAA